MNVSTNIYLEPLNPDFQKLLQLFGGNINYYL